MVNPVPFDALVIGGGLIGMLTARELHREGLRVAVVERQATGGESTWAGGGILSPLHPWRYPDAVNALATWSQAAYPDLLAALAEESGVDPEYRRNGLLIVDGFDPDEALAWAKRWQRELELVDDRRVRELEPSLGVEVQTAAWLPTVGQVRNPRLGRALRRSLDNLGVTVLEYRPVTGFVLQGERIVGVETAEGEIAAGAVVVASGAWSGTLLDGLGLAVPVAPVRGQMLLFHAEPGVVSRILLDNARYVIPRRDGRVLVGSTMENVGFDKSTTAEALAELRAAAARLVPALAHYPLERHWAGLRPGSPHGIPYISPHPRIEGLFVNAGHFRNGVVMGPASARLLANLVLGHEPILDPSPYRLSGNIDPDQPKPS